MKKNSRKHKYKTPAYLKNVEVFFSCVEAYYDCLECIDSHLSSIILI